MKKTACSFLYTIVHFIACFWLCSYCALMCSIPQEKKRAIVIGASAGTGKEIAKRLAHEDYTLGLAARRTSTLQALANELPGTHHVKQIDVTSSDARSLLTELIAELGGLDLCVISISAYADNRFSSINPDEYHPEYGWQENVRYLHVDAISFIAMADVALHYFRHQGHGHLVGLSLTTALRGDAKHPVYSAAKACTRYYLEGMRNKIIQDELPIDISDVIILFVGDIEHSPMGEDPWTYWETPVSHAGELIMQGIKGKRHHIYVPEEAAVTAFLLNWLPDTWYNTAFSWL